MGHASHIVGANAGRARGHNRQMVLERVRQAGQIGRAEIARGSGLSTQAVSNIIADLLSDGLIAEKGRRASTRGQPPVQYGLNPKGGYAVGLEIRPDAIFAAVLDFCGKPVASLRRTLTARDLVGVTDAAIAAKAEVLRLSEVPVRRVLGVGIVMPGPFGRTGISGTESELPVFHEIAPAEWFAEAMGLPVIVENDANAAAVAERVSGVATGLSNFAFLYFGTGLGLGAIQDGRLISGAMGNAGEIGHIPVLSKGETVALESVLSRLSVQRHLRSAGYDVDDSAGLTNAFVEQNPALLDWLDDAVEPLANALTIIENLLDPETIILGGAMPQEILDTLIVSVPLAERSVAHRQNRSMTRLLRGASGRMTGTLGAAALVLNRTFTPSLSASS